MEDLHARVTKLKHLEFDKVEVYADDVVEDQAFQNPTENLDSSSMYPITQAKVQAQGEERKTMREYLICTHELDIILEANTPTYKI